jgi:pyridoxal phosphate enzyme (YggS family)
MLIRPQKSSIDTGLGRRIRAVRDQIALSAQASARTEDSITLVAVSKGHAAAVVRAAVREGLEHFGENYLQEALPKIAELGGVALTWHFLGRIQTNKTRAVAENFSWVHGIDRLRVAERLAEQRPTSSPPLNVCIQVNIAGDASKAGVTPAQAEQLALAIAPLPNLKLRGLMCMLPDGLSSTERRRQYSQLHQLLRRLQIGLPSMDSLSMGMSADFEDAICAGATLVRVGTAIFGPRPAANA